MCIMMSACLRQRKLSFGSEQGDSDEKAPAARAADKIVIDKRGEFVCDEPECGTSHSGNDYTRAARVLVRTSRVARNAGLGLFAKVVLENGYIVGFMGGRLTCSVCVRREKLTVGRNRYRALECGTTFNIADEEVLWFLVRTNESTLDGCCWYINSTSNKNGKRNCEWVCCSFTASGQPMVYVRTVCRVEVGEELLLDYMVI